VAAPACDDLSDTVERARALFGPLRWDGEMTAGEFVLPIGTVTLLLADIEGSTRAWERGPDEMAAAVAQLDGVLDDLIGLHEGVRPVEQGEGDSFVIAFARASDAVECALALQRRLAEPEPASPLRLRIGLHTGEVQLRDEGNYVGPAINRAARLRDAAHGGQTVVSQATYELVRDRLPERSAVTDLGVHRLRDLGRPEHVFQLSHTDLPSEFPPLRTLDRARHNLPVQLSTFVGREPELAVLTKLLAETRMLTLTGAGGCGKTRLAVEQVARHLDAYPGGVWFVDLSLVTDPRAVVAAAASALRVREQPGRKLVDVVADQLDGAPTMLVVDNCEHVLSGAAEFVEGVLGACPELSVVVTSREPLGVPGETAWRVPSLSVPAPSRSLRTETLAQFEAVQLFVDRARKARPNFLVTNETAPAVAAICQRLDGIPLAIELAAARVRVLSAQEILDGLGDRFRLLTGGSRTVVARQQTLRASVDWSYQLLTDAERVALARLSVCAAGCTLDAAEAIAGAEPIDRLAVLDVLQGLVDKSLLLVDDVRGGSRYRMLETIRQYALEQLDDRECDAVRARHAAFFVGLAERAAPHLERREQDEWAAVLEDDWRNLRVAFDSADAAGDGTTMLRLVAASFWFFVLRGHVGEGWRLCQRALQRREGAPDDVRARGLVAAAYLAFFRVDPSGLALGEEARDAARASGDRRTEGRALYSVAWWTQHTDRDLTMALIDESISIAREVGDDWSLAMSLGERGTLLVAESDPEVAAATLEATVAVCEQLGERYIVNTARYHLARAWAFVGRTDDAVDLFERVIEHARSTGDTFSLTMTQADLAMLRALRGEYDDALQLAFENAARFDDGRLPWPQHAAQAIGTAGTVALLAGRYEEALTALETARRRTQGLPTTLSFVAASLAGMAVCEHALGDSVAAGRHYEEALGFLEEAASWRAAMAREQLSRAAYVLGDVDRARMHAHDAVAMSAAIKLVYWTGTALAALDALAVSTDDPQAAARLLGAVDARYADVGHARPVYVRATYEDTVTRAREALADEYDGYYADGTTLSVEDAIAYAQRGRGRRRRAATGWDSLTPAEQQVVELVAQGLSNPQIGERLFVSRKTVTSHLSHVFAKLGVTSRAELSAEAARRGL
jgi:predicted ATPase/class 3 adenylate cyclase/DNA-binding CsgD family transcriptional regulator